jgi:hypothetical protein
MKAKAPKRSGKLKPRSRKPRRLSADAPSGCGYSLKWSLLPSTSGFTQVWIPNKKYDKAAAHFIKKAKGRYAKNLFRQRMAPLGVDYTCGGTCEGGFCQEHMIGEGIYVCECAYYA